MCFVVLELLHEPDIYQILDYSSLRSSTSAAMNSLFHTSPQSLQDLASLKIAFHIWSSVSSVSSNHGTLENKFYPHTSELQSVLDTIANIPRKIVKLIEDCFGPVTREISSWYNHFQKDLYKLSIESMNHIRDRSNLLSFGGNGTVNFKDTITNFLEDESLSIVVKFEISCVYCMEEKIDLFWPQVRCILGVNHHMRFDGDFMLYYWICRKKNELDRIPLRGHRGIERLMISKCSQRHFYLAVEYFLSLLDPEDRLVEINGLCESEAGFKCIKYLLPRLDISLQRYVLHLRPTRILVEFIESYQQIDYIVQCWFFIKDFMTAERFCEDIILGSIRQRNQDEFQDQMFRYIYIETLLAEIWSSTPYHLKEYTLNFHFADILQELCLCNVDLLPDFGRDIQFLLTMLSDVTVSWKKDFWMLKWSQWIDNVPPAQFKELMKVCLVNPKAFSDFAKNLKDTRIFQMYCDKLISLGHHNEFDGFIDGLYPNERAEVKKYLLTKCTVIFNKPYEFLEKHVKYIDEVFSNDIQVIDFKTNLILSDAVMTLLYDQIKRNRFKDVEIIVSLFVSSKRHLTELKTNFLKIFLGKIINGVLYGFEKSSWMRFLTWCLNNDQRRIDRFMFSLPINDIFEKACVKCLTRDYSPFVYPFFSSYPCRAQDLVNFLMWYFGSEDTCTNFICARIRYYRRMSTVNVNRIFKTSKALVIYFMQTEVWTSDDIDQYCAMNRMGCVEYLLDFFKNCL